MIAERKTVLPIVVAVLSLISISVEAQRLRWTPELGLESRVFFSAPQFEDQFAGVQNSLIMTGDLQWVSADRRTRVAVEPFLRVDSRDSERTYADIREASVFRRFGEWDLLAGVTQVFWGVAESRNVVDVINQFDTVEDFDQGEKLGQPALRLGRRTRVGRVEAFYLPFFRKQRLPGRDGRLRFDPPVDSDAASFERGGEEWAGDVAVRYSNSFDRIDLGVHAFQGTSRNPSFVPGDNGESLEPRYQKLRQAGIDLQFTDGPWLIKFEGAGLDLGGDRFFASVAGFEYTFFDMQRSGIDLGVIGEYLYDGRDGPEVPPQLFDNDLFLGLRLTANDAQDTELLAGVIRDMETDAVIGSVEFQRRLGSRMLLELEGRYFDGGSDPFVAAFDRDSHITLRLTRYF
ncbi:MAG: hypothetical protein AAFY29_12215 [Pseudomonadota bacterium]